MDEPKQLKAQTLPFRGKFVVIHVQGHGHIL